MLGTKQRVEAQFRDANATVRIFKIRADYADSIALLRQNRLRPLTYKRALTEVYQNPELREHLKGQWFYLAGKGIKESGYYTFDNEGKLREGRGDIERTVHVYPGKYPLSLDVLTDHSTRFNGRRFDLNADYDPQIVAPLVVGAKAGGEAALLTAATETDSSRIRKLKPLSRNAE